MTCGFAGISHLVSSLCSDGLCGYLVFVFELSTFVGFLDARGLYVTCMCCFVGFMFML